MYTYHIHVHIFHVLSHIRVLIPKPYKLARQYMLGIDTLMYDSKWNNYVCTCVHCMCTYYIPPHTDQSKCMCRAESSLSLSLSVFVCVCVCVRACVCVCVCVCVYQLYDSATLETCTTLSSKKTNYVLSPLLLNIIIDLYMKLHVM